jgi:hypothetical protein
MRTRLALVRVLPWVGFAACAALIAVLAQRQRDLTRAYTDLRRRTAVLQVGDVVPTFRATTLDGALVTIGAAAAADARQALFILRTTCPYCLATLPVWERLTDSLRRVSGRPTDIFAISLDSAAASRLCPTPSCCSPSASCSACTAWRRFRRRWS